MPPNTSSVAALLIPFLAAGLVGQDLRMLDLPNFAAMGHDSARGHAIALSWEGATYELDGAGWRRLPVAHAPLARHLAYDTFRNRMLSVGGDDGTHFVTSAFDGVSWTGLPTASSPSRRWDFVTCFDVVRGELVLFGGTDATTLMDLNDTWVFDGQQWQQRQPVHSPAPTKNSAGAFDLLRGVTVLYRGESGETWEWDGTDWTQRVGIARPGHRRGASMAFDPIRQQTLLYGSYNLAVHDELWAWDGADWTQLSPSGAIPPARLSSQLSFDFALGETVLVDTERQGLQDTWSWNGTRWLLLSQPVHPANGQLEALFASPAGQLHGLAGRLSQTYVAETWKWQDRRWQVVPGNQPPLRSFAATATGPNHAYVLGGVHGSGSLLHDLWGFDGAQWTLLSTSAPPNRMFHAMAYDWARHELVCFGGLNGNHTAVSAETWVFDGVTWHQRTPAIAPVARFRAVAAYDFTRGAVVMYGGESLGQGYLDDTWQWDGTNWSQVASPVTPMASPMSSLVFDAGRNAVVLLQPGVGTPLAGWQLSAQGWTPLTLGDLDPRFLYTIDLRAVGHPQPDGITLFSDTHLYRLDTRQALVATRGAPCTPAAPTLAAARWPAPGAADFALDLLRAPASSFAAVVVGLQATNIPVGSCSLLVQNGISLLVATSSYGFARVPIAVPPGAAFLGLQGHAQAAAFDSTAPSGFSLSGALDFTIGS